VRGEVTRDLRLGGRRRGRVELLSRRSARSPGCPLVTVRYPGCLADRARNGHGQLPGRGSDAPALSPIGLTAAALCAAGQGSTADLRVRPPGTLTCARCPAAMAASCAAKRISQALGGGVSGSSRRR
jgi:hypothetical protein